MRCRTTRSGSATRSGGACRPPSIARRRPVSTTLSSGWPKTCATRTSTSSRRRSSATFGRAPFRHTPSCGSRTYPNGTAARCTRSACATTRWTAGQPPTAAFTSAPAPRARTCSPRSTPARPRHKRAGQTRAAPRPRRAPCSTRPADSAERLQRLRL